MSPRPERDVDRRTFLRRGAGSAVALSSVSGFLSACGSSTSDGGGGAAIEDLALASPSNPQKLPIYATNKAIASGLKPEAGPLQIYNFAEFINPTVIKSFERKYKVKVEVTPFTTMDEAVAKLADGTVAFDMVALATARLAPLVQGQIARPLNHSYIPNLAANVWKTLQSPWYDTESRYTTPYTAYTTGIAWRADKLPRFEPARLKNPYSAFWSTPEAKGHIGLLDDEREALALALLHNGERDINTEDPAKIAAARNALTGLVRTANVKFATNDLQRITDASSWLQHSWSGDIAAAPAYLPKGVDPSVVRYYSPSRGVVNIGVWTTLKSGKNPVLAHLFLNHLLDEGEALENFSYIFYAPPLTALTPQRLRDAKLVTPQLQSAIVSEKDAFDGLAQSALSRKGQLAWSSAWAAVKGG